MVRTRVVQTLFAYYKNQGKTPISARKELLCSFSGTYSLYMMLLSFVNELTLFAEQQIEEDIRKAKITHKPFTPNRRFVENRFAKQIFENRRLRNYISEQKLSWDTGMSAICSIYKQLLTSQVYKDYMNAAECTYEDDKRIWRRIIEHMLPESESVVSALEEMEVQLDQQNWTTDLDVVATYVAKTIKTFHEDSTPEHPLLEMFDKEEELKFATSLLEQAIEHREEYNVLIEQHLRNWEADRVAYMDTIILQTALAEILNFPDIALEVSLNEYLELAKEYSSEKSHIFINGILDVILKSVREKEGLMKVLR